MPGSGFLRRTASRAAFSSRLVDEATAAAEAEDLPLIRSQNAAGFKHVSTWGACSESRPYVLQVAGKRQGSFATAEEAALAYARRVGRERAAEEAAGAAEGPWFGAWSDRRRGAARGRRRRKSLNAILREGILVSLVSLSSISSK